MEQKKRFLYIDALRGLCMILIIVLHSHLTIINYNINKMMVNMELPLFFFVSGFFFNRYGCFREFLVKKVNQLVVPYFFFSFIPICLFSFLYTNRYTDPLFYILAPVKPWNTPLWFLRTLFFTYLLYYVIDKYFENKPLWLKICVIVFLVAIAQCINLECKRIKDAYPLLRESSFMIDNIITAVVSLPYFFIAHQIKRRGWLEFKFNWGVTVIMMSVLLVVAYLSRQNNFYYYGAIFGENFVLGYLSAISSIFAWGIFLAKFKYTSLLQYLGKNSLIVLGCHAVPIIIFFENHWLSRINVFYITFFLMFPCIWFFKKCFPKFTGQEELFKLKKS